MRNDILKLIESIQNLNTKETMEGLIKELEEDTDKIAKSYDLIEIFKYLENGSINETWINKDKSIIIVKDNEKIKILFNKPITELQIDYKKHAKKEEDLEFNLIKYHEESKKSPTIVSIIGCSSSGKDSILREILKNNPKTLKGLVSHTSRPKRECELEGREYYFISKEEFINKLEAGEFIEYREYKVEGDESWLYGLHDSEIDINSDNIYVGIFDINGYWSLVDEYGKENVFPVYIDCDVVIRLERALSREGITPGTEKYREVLRRLYADSEEIEQYKNEFDTIFYNGNCLQEEFEDKVSCLVNSIIEYHECK